MHLCSLADSLLSLQLHRLSQWLRRVRVSVAAALPVAVGINQPLAEPDAAGSRTGANLIKLFSSQLTNGTNKLECFSLADLSSLVFASKSRSLPKREEP